MIEINEGVFWDTTKPLQDQSEAARFFVQGMICEDCKISAEKRADGFDGDPSNRFRQIFEKDGLRLTINTFFGEGFLVKAGTDGIKYSLETIA